MKLSKRISALLFLALLALVLPTGALAAQALDLTEPVGLNVSYQDEKIPLTGAEFRVYLVSAMEEDGTLQPTEPFSPYDVNVEGKNSAALRDLALTLEGYVLRDEIAPTDTARTDSKGIASFPTGGGTLTPGLYLILGGPHTQDGRHYDAAPSLVLLPEPDQEDAWVYEVTIETKQAFKPDTIDRKALKVWKDEGHQDARPKEITVYLFQDDEKYDTVTLNAENNWRHTWTELDGSSDWTVSEADVENYEATVTQEGVTFVVTNTYNGPEKPNEPTKPDEPRLPLTGQLWWPVPVLLMLGLLLIVLGMARRRGGKHEA